MPTIATRSLMPLLAMTISSKPGPRERSALRAHLPEVVVDAAGSVHAAERHLHLVADRDFLRLAVGHLAEEAAAALVVDDDVHRRRVERDGEAVERERRDLRPAVGER